MAVWDNNNNNNGNCIILVTPRLKPYYIIYDIKIKNITLYNNTISITNT